ncbi:hypothetical protein [Lacticaseibacillus suibinensis]|uniref:hypothetical protein n=1 Tax=Lacticaseibacillus suibinensis TaxID=2486011 RepID=UPI0019423851|nr:hypothetical protein [Lacticaseibacillus suibinensis]
MGFLTDWGPIIASLGSATASTWTGYKLNKFQKEQLAQQKEIENAKISAELKSKSRIEWIQKTKERTLDYIMACTELSEELKTMNPISTYQETDCLVDPCYKVMKTGNALILEFGTKRCSFKENKKFEDLQIYLLNSEDNKNKNEDIVSYILHVVDPISKFLIDREKRFLTTQALLDNGMASIYDVESLFDNNYIANTRDIMRRYLKIEWDIAKEGK